MKQILHQKAGTILENVQYQYDASGSRTRYQRTNPHPPLPDELGATFDSANEMLSLGDLSGQGGASFQYDENGNLASRTDSCGTTTYSWDGRNRLTGMSGYKPDCAPLSASFKYDALGRRTEKTVNGSTTKYLHDGVDVAAEVEGGTVTATYLRSLSIDEPFSRTKSGTTSYYLQDALGSVIGLAGATGALGTTYAYDAFGGTTAAGALSDQPFKYTGREDDGTGLYYYRARYYDPKMRRFISEDPIGLKGGDVNYYAYVGNDPVGEGDPFGLSSLVFNRNGNTLSVYNAFGHLLFICDSANNVVRRSRGPFPGGTFSFSHYNPHPENGPTGPFGCCGIYVFNVPGRSGMGVHSGQQGPESPTYGCLRTNDWCTQRLYQLHQQWDPVTRITVR